MKITVRPSIRVLGILLSLLIVVVSAIVLIERSYDSLFELGLLLSSILFFLPLVLSSCILGHVPYFLTRHIPEEMKEELLNSEVYFTEFSSRSIGFVIGTLIVAGTLTYFINQS